MEIFDKIEQWAADRDLIDGARVHSQMLKLTEEVGELASGIAKKKDDLIKDGIGDCVVVLTILAKQSGFSIIECIESAYDEINDRKGETVDGVFIKN